MIACMGWGYPCVDATRAEIAQIKWLPLQEALEELEYETDRNPYRYHGSWILGVLDPRGF